MESGATATPQLSTWGLTSAEGTFRSIPLGVTTIGRGETNDLCLDDIKASRFHAELRTTAEGMEVIDLNSTNGTFVNGECLTPTQPRALHEGDEIVVAKTRFTVSKD